MLLIAKGLDSREFLIQFGEIMGEFGDVIPWLYPLRRIAYLTNADYFRDQFLSRLGCMEEEDVVPFQFVTSDLSREYVGGVLNFSRSIEKFADSRNQRLNDMFNDSGYRFLSCLQIRRDLRGQRHGPRLVREVVSNVRATCGKFWGVVSDPRLISWYQSFGGKLQSPVDNIDGLWIVSWE